MLINSPDIVLGSWGLINADPVIGDPSETEMDTILILTKDSYYVADYDDQVDKITKYQKILLKDITSIESGVVDNTSFLKISKGHFCIRLNYAVDGDVGFYHMFRSTNLRFFNNLAVVIKNEEEEIGMKLFVIKIKKLFVYFFLISESLKSICEAFVVAFEICNLPPITYHQFSKLEKRKSKIFSTDVHSSSIYLDIVNLPQITRNVSETQLLALKNAGKNKIFKI